MINISFRPEYVLRIGHLMVSNTFLASMAATLLLVLGAVWLSSRMRRRPNAPGAKVALALMGELLGFVDSITEDRGFTKRILPLVATFFVYIVTANVMALLPGFDGGLVVHAAGGTKELVRSANSDLTSTLALALFSVLATQYFSWRILGGGGYLRRFFDFSSVSRFILGLFEMLSEGVRVLSFSFRLFGNILAGEILLVVIELLIPWVLPVPFMLLEVFVGVLQGFIFASLTATFMRTDTFRAAPAAA